MDGHTYELCSDLVDVVIDVSCIYGLSPQDGAAIPYDQDSSSAIHLNSGMVLYLREVCGIYSCFLHINLKCPATCKELIYLIVYCDVMYCVGEQVSGAGVRD